MRHQIFVIVTIFLLTLSVVRLSAQSTLTGSVYDEENQPLSGSNVILLHSKDSTIALGTVANATGAFVLDKVPPGSYLLNISFIGYDTRVTPLIITSGVNQDLGRIVLNASTAALDGLVIKSSRPMFEMLPDRMLVNVKNNITTVGGSVLDLLARSPGVIVNRATNSILMSGKDGVNVMINGKMNYISPDALVPLLESMQAANVERIELITTPPARFDASGNAGYINIVLAQNPNEGLNGNISLTAAAIVGSYPKASLDFNYRKNKSNLYGSYGIGREAIKQTFSSLRRIYRQKDTVETHVVSERDPVTWAHNYRLGYDYDITKKTTLGLLVSGQYSKWVMDAVNTTQFISNNAIDSNILVDNHELHTKSNLVGNFNILHRPSEGSEISFNADYIIFDDKNPTDYDNTFFFPSAPSYTTQLTSSKKTLIKVLPIQLDYKRKVSAKVNIETGLKTVFTNLSNDVLVANLVSDVWIPNPEFTANAKMKENILAAYVSGSYTINANNSMQAGLRYEHTYTNFSTESLKNIIDRRYGELFPTLYWQHKFNDKNNFTLSYNRRITRPSFQDLAPFLIFSDPYTFVSGNPALQPSIADGVSLSYLLRQIVFTTGLTYIKDDISGFQDRVDTATNKSYTTAQNMAYRKSVNLGTTLPFNITKWWTSLIVLNTYWQQSEAKHLSAPLTIEQFWFSGFSSQRFRIGHGISVELSGFYQGKSIDGAGILQPLYKVDISAQKKFEKSGGAITFGLDNVFDSFVIRVATDASADHFYSSADLRFSHRLFKLTWSQPFGKSTVKGARERGTASDDEQKRM